jgi:rhodanese-related sulfurtransferase
MKGWVALLFTPWMLSANMLYSLQYKGVDVAHHNGKTYHLERLLPLSCSDVPITNSVIWKRGDAFKAIPDVCKSDFVTTAGVVTPMVIADGIETYGELEVLEFIQKMHKADEALFLIDSRGFEWYEYETIPGAVNIWYKVFQKPDLFSEEFAAALKQMGAVKVDTGYDFTTAATLLLFCNGAWCGQSPMAIRALLKLGYPPQKLKWYRGVIQGWKSLSMSTTRWE